MRRGVVHGAVARGWLWVLLLSVVAAAAGAPASAAPARLRVTVTRDGVAETQVVERTAPRGVDRGMRGEKLSLSGNGWSLQGVIAGFTRSDSGEQLQPRGGILIYEARLGFAGGFINATAAPINVEIEGCLDPLPIGGTAVYGGSIAGSVLDADGDGTGSVKTNSVPNPIYELRLDTALCAAGVNGTRTTIDTLYDAPKTVNVPGIYQGATIAEEFFGSPIPNSPGSTAAPAFEMVLRFQLTPGDFTGFSMVGVVVGQVDLAEPVWSAGAAAPQAQPVVARGIPTPSPATGPVYSLGLAVGDKISSDSPPAPTPTPTPVATPFNKNITIAVSPTIVAPSRHGGIVLGSVTDFSGGSCTVRTKSGIALYRASVDGTPQFSLYGAPSAFMASGFHSSLIAPQTFGAPIPSMAGPVVNTNLRLDLDYEFLNDCMASFLALYVVAKCADPSFDVDGNGSVAPLTDGLIILRFLFGFSGPTLTAGALGAGATRTDPAAIVAFLNCLASTMLDVDDNDAVTPLTDGLLILRHLFGFSGSTLTSNALGPGAMRTDPTAITTFMNQFIP
jgi:hypothetical protein